MKAGEASLWSEAGETSAQMALARDKFAVFGCC
jgi:hypothetical protein